MQLYVDSANLTEIQHAASLGFISGVTTNPSLLAKEDPSIDIRSLILDIHKSVGGHTSVEVISTETDGMLREADEILKWFPEATIKIPFIPAGLTAVRKLAYQNIPTNVTLLFTATQALIAANAGATYVSLFMGSPLLSAHRFICSNVPRLALISQQYHTRCSCSLSSILSPTLVLHRS